MCASGVGTFMTRLGEKGGRMRFEGALDCGSQPRSVVAGECEGGTVIDRAAKVPKNPAVLSAADHVMSAGKISARIAWAGPRRLSDERGTFAN